MDCQKLFYENMLLEVYDHQKQVYGKSIVQEVNRDNIAIGVPMKKKEKIALQEGEEYTFRAALEDALYYFQSRVLRTKFSGNVLLYLISWPQKVERRQRRNYFRLPCSLEAHYLVISESGPDSPAEAPEVETALVANLSGGGLLLVTGRALPLGTILLLRLFLQSKKEKKEILVKGKIVRGSPQKIGKKAVRYRYGVEFFDLSEKDRDQIIRYLFTIMRERLS